MNENKKEIYDAIIRDAEEKKKAQLVQLRKNKCPICLNSGNNCLNLKQSWENGQIFKCVNFKDN
jgi:hypothetical protein